MKSVPHAIFDKDSEQAKAVRMLKSGYKLLSTGTRQFKEDFITIDGTKIKANASNNSAVKKDELPDLNEIIQREIEEGIKVDEAEDETYGDKNTDELPDGITRKTIVERVQDKYQAGDERRKDEIKKQIVQSALPTQSADLCRTART